MRNTIAITLLLNSAISAGQFIPPGVYNDEGQGPTCYRKEAGQTFDLDGHSVENISFYAERSPLGIWLADKSEVSFTWREYASSAVDIDSIYRVDMTFPRANEATPVPLNTTGDLANYFGRGEAITQVKAYHRVSYPNLYAGIDLHFHHGLIGPRLSFVVLPGADPSDIQISFHGQDSIMLDLTGQLKLYLKSKYVKLNEARAYQVNPLGQISFVDWSPSYILEPGGVVASFSFGLYNPALPLVLEIGMPSINLAGGQNGNLGWSTYLGGTGEEIAYVSEKDEEGNLFVGGYSTDNTFPVTPGAFQIAEEIGNTYTGFVSKFNADRELVWSTFLGGSLTDEVRGMHHNNGLLSLTGYTFSSDFPILQVPGGFFDGTWSGNADAFFVDLTSDDGFVAFSTYVGGAGDDRAFGLTSNSLGEKFLTGYSSNGFPEQPNGAAYFQPFSNNSNDAFLMRLGTNYELLWSTAIGGNGFDYPLSISSSGTDFFLTGTTTSSDLPIVTSSTGYNQEENAGNTDLFIARFDGLGVLTWLTYFGGSGSEKASEHDGIAIGSEKVFVSIGATSSSDLPLQTSNGAFFDAVYSGDEDGAILAFDRSTNELLWSTYLGSDDQDQTEGVVIDEHENLFVVGSTKGATFPYVPLLGAYNQEYAGPFSDPFSFIGDCTIMGFNTNTYACFWSTMIGGAGLEGAFSVEAIEPDRLVMVGVSLGDFGLNYPLLDYGGDSYYQVVEIGADAVISEFDLTGLDVGLKPLSLDRNAVVISYEDEALIIQWSHNEATVNVYDPSGKLVARTNGNGSATVLTGSWAVGIYCIEIVERHTGAVRRTLASKF